MRFIVSNLAHTAAVTAASRQAPAFGRKQARSITNKRD